VADVHSYARRHTRESEYRKEPRQAPECERKPEPNSQRGEHAADQLDRAMRRNSRAEHARPKCGKAEACNALSLRLRNEEQRKAETRYRPTEMREPDHRTNTAARLA
jgi:hypothetical protein